jgi:autotransporter family porin
MNLFHKIVWNTSRQQYVVTSELARGKTKSALSSIARATSSLGGSLAALPVGMLNLSRMLVLAGLVAPGLVLASSCNTGTPGQSAPVGGTCTLPAYNPPNNNAGEGGAVVNNGATITLGGTPNFGSGYDGNTTVPANTVTTITGTFNSSSLVTGPQTTAVIGPNAATGTNVVFQTFNSAALTDQSNINTPVNQYENVSGDEYVNASIGAVGASGGTLNVNVGDTPTGSPASNTIALTAKQTYLTSADGTGGANSRVIWRSRNAIDMGIDPALPTPNASGLLSVEVPVTAYAGNVTFNGITYAVNNAAQLAAYNNVLVAALQSGQLTSQDAYNTAFNAAFTNSLQTVTYNTNTTAGDLARMPMGDRYAILANGARGSAVIATGGQIDITRASGAVKATNGATITNNGTLSGNVINQVAQIESGSHFINGASGVVSSGYLVGDKLNTATDTPFYYTGSGILATDAGTTVVNNGTVNVAGFAFTGNTSIGIGVDSGAMGTNHGAINVGVNPGYVTTVVGANVSGHSTFTNAADGTIYIGRAAQYALGDPTVDVATNGPSYGIRIMDTGDTATNLGQITIGSQTQNAVGMFSTGPLNSTLINAGTITINGAAGGVPLTNIGIFADDNGSAASGSVARNTGTININGVNGIGVMVNADPGSSANADSTGTINVNGNADPVSGTRNFGMWVSGPGAVGTISGALNLNGTGAIGVFAQDGGTITVASGAVPHFNNTGTDQIGFFASGANSSINVAAQNLSVDTARSTLFRVADGANYTGSSSSGTLGLTIAGEDARGVVATGNGTTLSTGASIYNVTGAAGILGGAAAIVDEGGAAGSIDSTTTINLGAVGAIAGIVDGQGHDLTGATVDAPVATTLNNNAPILSATPGVIGFISRNQGTLVNNNAVLLTGARSTGVVVGNQGTVQNNATIHVANGDGALVMGAGANLVNNGTIQADNGTAAIHLTGPGATVALSGSGLVLAGGTADGILLDATNVGGSVTGNAVTISVNGSGRGIDNLASNAIIDLTDTTINTSGAGAHGIGSTGANASINVTNGSITTTGAQAIGAYVGNGGVFTLNNGSITTSNAFATGVMADSGATAALFGGSITTGGANSTALLASGASSAITARGTRLVSGGGAGATADAGGALSLIETSAQGAGAGIAVTDNTASGNTSAIVVSGGSVAASTGDAITVTGARAGILIGNGAVLSAASGALLNATNGSTVNFTVNGETLNGNLLADNSSTVQVNLQNGSTLTGRVDPLSMSIDGTSTWNVVANSTLANLSNAGIVNVIAPTGNPTLAGSYKTVSATNYTGANGTIGLNTYLGTDNSPTDKLVINGGTATGTTGLKINNTGGPGAFTGGDGINVVATTNGGTTGASAFRLTAPVQRGAYEYLLYRGGVGNPDGYYLRTTLSDPSAPSTPASQASAPVAYRPGVAAYALTPQLNLDYGFSNLGRLQERVGDIAGAERNQKGNSNGVWGRISGQGLDADSNHRFSVDETTFAMQFGKDWTLSVAPDGGSTHAGLTASIGVSNASFKDNSRTLNPTLTSKAGTAVMQAQGVGGYFTKYLQDGSYSDSVVQVTHYGNKYRDVYGNNASQNGAGFALSQEVGKPFALTNSVSIEPQAQLMYQYLKLNSFDDNVSGVGGTSSNAIRGRLGFRIFMPNISNAKGDSAATPYFTADVLHDFLSPKATVVDNTSLDSNLGRTWGEVGVGISTSIGKSGELYASTKYAKNIGGEDRRGVYGQVGYRYSW